MLQLAHLGEVVGLSLAMFASTFAMAYVPLKISIDGASLNKFTLFGAGLLVGAALSIIVPEGIVVLVATLSKH